MTSASDNQEFIARVHDRRKPLADVLADDEYSGIRKFVEEMYPDRAHFIYELLQNAEDSASRSAQPDSMEVDFNLHNDRLIFTHSGEPFSDEDVLGITNIGKSTKEDDAGTIGRFGIGFKSVFAYSETPIIKSPTYCFTISNLVLPTAIEKPSDLGQSTRFEFPFNSPKKTADRAYEEIVRGLNELNIDTLLFLQNIKTIRWSIDGKVSEFTRLSHSDSHIEIIKTNSGVRENSCHFLRFYDSVAGVEDRHVGIAFNLELLENVNFDTDSPLKDQLKICPATPGNVSIFFPAKKEVSGLRFHLHAPFVPELSRASIKDTDVNLPLYEQLASLAANSLHQIRDTGLLTPEFLSVLPNLNESIPEQYCCIREAIIDEMNSKPLTPTRSKGFAPASELLQAKASVKSLLSKEDLTVLVGVNGNWDWAIGASQKNSLQDHFLDSLEITDWGITSFCEILKGDYRGELKAMVSEWLVDKEDVWLQQMYSLLYQEVETRNLRWKLGDSRLVRIENGEFRTGKKTFFPTDQVENEESFPRVKRAILETGKKKSDKQNARAFLEAIGVQEIGEREELLAILTTRYTRNSLNPRKGDLKRFISYARRNPEDTAIFKNYFIFQVGDDVWATPLEVYLDKPFRDTGLNVFFEYFQDDDGPFPLHECYQNFGIKIEKIADFASSVGALTTLKISTTSCRQNPEWQDLRRAFGERFTSPIDRDYTIEGLVEILDEPNLAISKLIWNTMNSLPQHSYLEPDYLTATYQKNNSGGSRHADSQLVHLLRNAEWVPQGNNEFVLPRNARREKLPGGFSFDSDRMWIRKIQFGQELEKGVQQRRLKKHYAKELGLEEEDVSFIQDHHEEFLRFKAGIQSRQANQLQTQSQVVKNPERRKKKIQERLKAAESKQKVIRPRSVSKSSGNEIDREALFQFYRRGEQLFCQVCFDQMPFKRRNGDDCGECVDLFTFTWAERKEIDLKVFTSLKAVLCPVCSEIYREYVHHDLTRQSELFEQLKGKDEVAFTLCSSEATADKQQRILTFNPQHLADIRAAVDAMPQ